MTLTISEEEFMTLKAPNLTNSALNQMAENFFGYGRWDAPHWFIGPEARMGRMAPTASKPGTIHGSATDKNKKPY